ncbi:hypothetical protein [Novosphingobium aquae]|jgi:hypothetical protein|uniref:LTXXQ motif family protein n=1 Tax=Novosphingobium aquae TaxID=3133435 RepID=A0ABU8SEE9_9SPHN
MISRISLTAALAVAALVPSSAMARPAGHGPYHNSRVAERLTDPALQARASAMAAIMSEMLLDLRVGPLARAMGEWGDPELRDVPYDARVRDFAGPDLRELPRDIAREMPRAMGQMGRTAGAIEGMIPEFERMADEMRRAIDREDRRADRYSDPRDY